MFFQPQQYIAFKPPWLRELQSVRRWFFQLSIPETLAQLLPPTSPLLQLALTEVVSHSSLPAHAGLFGAGNWSENHGIGITDSRAFDQGTLDNFHFHEPFASFQFIDSHSSSPTSATSLLASAELGSQNFSRMLNSF
jgi:hypothetical protein